MRIGIDVTPLEIRGGRHGTGSYLRGLLKALGGCGPQHEFVLFAYDEAGVDLEGLPSRFRVRRLPVPALGRARALASHQVVLPLMA